MPDRRRHLTMRFGSTAKVLLKCKLKYYRISECICAIPVVRAFPQGEGPFQICTEYPEVVKRSWVVFSFKSMHAPPHYRPSAHSRPCTEGQGPTNCRVASIKGCEAGPSGVLSSMLRAQVSPEDGAQQSEVKADLRRIPARSQRIQLSATGLPA